MCEGVLNYHAQEVVCPEVVSCDSVETAAPHPRQNHGSPVAAVTSSPSPPNRITRALLLSRLTRTIFSSFACFTFGGVAFGSSTEVGEALEEDLPNKLLNNPLLFVLVVFSAK